MYLVCCLLSAASSQRSLLRALNEDRMTSALGMDNPHIHKHLRDARAPSATRVFVANLEKLAQYDGYDVSFMDAVILVGRPVVRGLNGLVPPTLDGSPMHPTDAHSHHDVTGQRLTTRPQRRPRSTPSSFSTSHPSRRRLRRKTRTRTNRRRSKRKTRTRGGLPSSHVCGCTCSSELHASGLGPQAAHNRAASQGKARGSAPRTGPRTTRTTSWTTAIS